MPEPLVCAIMLTKDRPAMAKRAVECFRKQTYQNKRILVVNSGPKPLFTEATDLREPCFVGIDALTIGALRNHAARYASSHYTTRADCPEIFIHWDDDDYSHPSRISEQVALLQASGKQCVGYRDMLFWRECCHCDGGRANMLPRCLKCGLPYNPNRPVPVGEAWLYHNDDPRYCLGTSLCYWREVWEKRPFKRISRGEDKAWLREVDSLGVSSFGARTNPDLEFITTDSPTEESLRWAAAMSGFGSREPRMIASIHSGNHVVYEPEKSLPPPAGNWKRVPEWDNYCRERMAL